MSFRYRDNSVPKPTHGPSIGDRRPWCSLATSQMRLGFSDSVAVPFELLKSRIRRLYEGETLLGVRFRYALLALDIVTVLFIVATSFLPRSQVIEALDVVFGVSILADFSARLIISRHPLRDFTRVSTWTDIVVDHFISCASDGRSRWFPAYPSYFAAAARLSDGGAAAADSLVLSAKRGSHFRRHEPRRFHFRDDWNCLRDPEFSQQSNRQLCRRALLHGYRADHDRLRRHYVCRERSAA